MKIIRCPKCAGVICKAETAPVEARCASCKTISLYDGSGNEDKARPMGEVEVQNIKNIYHTRRKEEKSRDGSRGNSRNY